MKIIENTYHLISLGCAKNLVDSHAMRHLLAQNALDETTAARSAKYLIVNTCGFIESARQESLETLRNLAKKKKPGQFLIAAGCMSQRMQAKLLEEVEGIDAMLGTRRWMDIHKVLSSLQANGSLRPYLHFPIASSMGRDEGGAPAIAIQGKSSYLKIADGCNRPCAYCAIPLIKGSLVSRPVNSIIDEMRILQDAGIREVNLIAQDITGYGQDLGSKDGLFNLLDDICAAAPNIPWIRLLYTFPGFNVNEMVRVMKAHPQVLHYIDIPLQHADQTVLKAMKRPSHTDRVLADLQTLRSNFPDLAVRTTFIVGFPGETDRAFQTLVDFIEQVRFNHLGAFTYSFEKGTSAERLGDPIPIEVKEERLAYLMEIQAKISSQINHSFIGETLDVLIEGADPNSQILVGRTKRDAPEVDGLVIAQGVGQVGEILQVKIDNAVEHDLFGRVVTYKGDL